MILELLIIGGAGMVVSSFAFALALVRRYDQFDPSSDVPVLPFEEITLASRCIKCGRKSTASDSPEGAAGPRAPTICRSNTCPSRRTEHLHVFCFTCKGEWRMATKDSETDGR